MAGVHIEERRRGTHQFPAADQQPAASMPIRLAATRRRRTGPPTQAAGTAPTQSRYRRSADTFVMDQDGVVTVWNGIDKVRRFDAAVGSYENAGVIAPTSAPTIGGSGSGNIVGTYYAYVRFVDRSGNYSSLSPVAVPYEASSGSFTVTGATNASPIVVTTSAAHGLGSGQIVKISEVMGNDGTNGIYAARVLSTTTFELYADQSLTVPTIGTGAYNSGGVVTTGVSRIIYGSVPTSSEAKVVRRQILRNQDGALSVFYVDVDTTDLTSTTIESMTTSESLIEGVSLEDVSGHTLVDKSLPPNYKRTACFHGGRIFAAGNEPYSEGACVVTNGSTTVTGIGTQWGVETFADRKFMVIGGAKQYTIGSVASTTSLTLTEAYSGSTDPYAYYVIQPGDGERRTFYWSEPSEPEAWPLENTLTMAEDPNAGEITGIMSQDSWIYLLTDYRIYRFSFVNNPLLDGFVTKSARRGCINSRCWQQVEGVAYMLDRTGFHAFAGNDDVDVGQPMRDLFTQVPVNKYRINWAASRNFHSVFDPGEGVIRWFICLSGSYMPFHAAAYSVRLRRWWLEEYPWPVASSCIGRLNGRPQVFIGTTGKRIMALNASTLDGMRVLGTTRGTVTTSGIDWIADSAASFQSSNLAGNFVTIVRGRGKGQRRMIRSVSGTRINVKEPWTIRPDTTSVYQIGGVSWAWRSGWMQWRDSDYNSVRTVSVQSKATTNEAEQTLRLYRDLATTPAEWVRPMTLDDGNGIAMLADDTDSDLTIDTTKASGTVKHRLDAFREFWNDETQYIQAEVSGVQNDQQQVLLRVLVEGA